MGVIEQTYGNGLQDIITKLQTHTTGYRGCVRVAWKISQCAYILNSFKAITYMAI